MTERGAGEKVREQPSVQPGRWSGAMLQEMAMGHFMLARALQVAAELDLFTCLALGPVPIRELAAQLNVERRGLEALLAVCISLHLIEKSDRGYRTTEAAMDLLVAGRPGNLSSLLAGASGLYEDWVHLDQAIRSGTATALAQREKGLETLRTYHWDMHRAAIPSAQSVVGTVDLSAARSLLDIGSGIGTFAIACCRRYPDLHATLFDLPGVVALAQGVLAQSDLAQRVQAIGGDYHQDALPHDHDVALLCNVLHQENEEKARRLLHKAHNALRRKGTLIVLDAVLDDDKCGPLSVALGALNQLIHHSGATYYSAAELSRWLREVGFIKVERKRFPFPHQALLVAVKA